MPQTKKEITPSQVYRQCMALAPSNSAGTAAYAVKMLHPTLGNKNVPLPTYHFRTSHNDVDLDYHAEQERHDTRYSQRAFSAHRADTTCWRCRNHGRDIIRVDIIDSILGMVDRAARVGFVCDVID